MTTTDDIVKAAIEWAEVQRLEVREWQKREGGVRIRLRAAVEAHLTQSQDPAPETSEERKHYLIDAGDFDPDKHESPMYWATPGRERWEWLSKLSDGVPPDYPIIVRDKQPDLVSLWTHVERAFLASGLTYENEHGDARMVEARPEKVVALVLDALGEYWDNHEYDLLLAARAGVRKSPSHLFGVVPAIKAELFGTKP